MTAAAALSNRQADATSGRNALRFAVYLLIVAAVFARALAPAPSVSLSAFDKLSEVERALLSSICGSSKPGDQHDDDNNCGHACMTRCCASADPAAYALAFAPLGLLLAAAPFSAEAFSNSRQARPFSKQPRAPPLSPSDC